MSSVLKKLHYKKFKSDPGKILILGSSQYLLPDIISACSAAGYDFDYLVFSDQDLNSILEWLSQKIVQLRPDFVFMFNNLGLDREGYLLDFFTKIKLPVFSWFIDNPFLFLGHYKGLQTPFLVLASWDKDNILLLSQYGIEHAFYLPLAVDLGRIKKMSPIFQRDVAFVGNSMQQPLNKAATFLDIEQLVSMLELPAQAFTHSKIRDIHSFLQSRFPQINLFRARLHTKAQLDFDSFFYWLATYYYRLQGVKKLFGFNPVIAGDEHWLNLLPVQGWDYHRPLNYYTQIFDFYAQTAINFNTTSMQMKGSVNQRIFDVPSAGSFVLTDYTEQVQELFEVKKEIICYRDLEQIPDLISYYLQRPQAREKICEAARTRIRKEHGYIHRLRDIYSKMKTIFE